MVAATVKPQVPTGSKGIMALWPPPGKVTLTAFGKVCLAISAYGGGVIGSNWPLISVVGRSLVAALLPFGSASFDGQFWQMLK